MCDPEIIMTNQIRARARQERCRDPFGGKQLLGKKKAFSRTRRIKKALRCYEKGTSLASSVRNKELRSDTRALT